MDRRPGAARSEDPDAAQLTCGVAPARRSRRESLSLFLRLRSGFRDPAAPTPSAVLVDRSALGGLVEGARRGRDHLAGLLTALADGIACRAHRGPRRGAA